MRERDDAPSPGPMRGALRRLRRLFTRKAKRPKGSSGRGAMRPDRHENPFGDQSSS